MSKKLVKRKFSKEHIKHLKESRQGRIYSKKTKEKMKRAHQGEKSHFWEGGKCVDIKKYMREYGIKWRKENSDKNKKCCKKWRKENYSKVLYFNLKRQTRKRNAEGSHTFEEWELLKKECNYTCLCCGLKEPFGNQSCKILTEDHIVPLSKNGTDFINNIQPLCRSCNCKKQTKIIHYEKINL